MPAISDSELLLLCSEALLSPRGVILATSDADQLKKRLYILRQTQRKKGDQSLDSLSFRTSPRNPTGEVWILNQQKQEAQPSGQE